MTNRNHCTRDTDRADACNPRLAAGASAAGAKAAGAGAAGAGAGGARPSRRNGGFTLVELLTSVFIIVIIMSIVFPVINSIKNGNRIEAGLNTVSMASDVARAWSTASLPQVDRGTDPVNPIFGATYSGTAAIFCPTNEIRIVINHQGADSTAIGLLEENGLNGYWDYSLDHGGKTDLDYIAIPQGTGVAGIYRNDSGAHLLAPPFAVAFNRDGQMVQGADIGGGDRVIFYDGDFLNGYDVNDTRPNGYNPSDWGRDAVASNTNTLVRPLPFEAIETVVGVVIYDESAFQAAGWTFDGGGDLQNIPDVDLSMPADGVPDPDPDNDPYDWLRVNGTTVFFSPNSGTALRDEGTE